MKILNKKKIKQQKMGEKVRREIKILKIFRHPHVMKIYEFFDTPDDVYVIMEYLAGGELFDIITKTGRVILTLSVHIQIFLSYILHTLLYSFIYLHLLFLFTIKTYIPILSIFPRQANLKPVLN